MRFWAHGSRHRPLACREAGLSGVRSSVVPLHGASVGVAADENAYRSIPITPNLSPPNHVNRLAMLSFHLTTVPVEA
jgi:hypothetical protein